jgi:GNAT superfamily N-acetyltransferase
MTETEQAELMNIVTFQPEYAEAFNRLNRAWLEGYGLYEDEDGKYLDHPQEMILDKGGEIFFALVAGEVIGTCAVIPQRENTVELAKLAVADRFQGRGIGRKLSETAIDWARQQQYPKIFLISSTKLAPALSLYERLGFAYGALPDDIGYQTADIYMELSLS